MEDPKQIGAAVIAVPGSHSFGCFCHFPTFFISNFDVGGLVLVFGRSVCWNCDYAFLPADEGDLLLTATN